MKTQNSRLFEGIKTGFLSTKSIIPNIAMKTYIE